LPNIWSRGLLMLLCHGIVAPWWTHLKWHLLLWVWVQRGEWLAQLLLFWGSLFLAGRGSGITSPSLEHQILIWLGFFPLFLLLLLRLTLLCDDVEAHAVLSFMCEFWVNVLTKEVVWLCCSFHLGHRLDLMSPTGRSILQWHDWLFFKLIAFPLHARIKMQWEIEEVL